MDINEQFVTPGRLPEFSLWSKLGDQRVPLSFDLELTARCNLRCVFCLDGKILPRQRQWVPLDRAKEELKRGWDAGCRSMGLLGGEPTVYPHLFELLAYANELGFQRMSLYTNGLRLGDAAFCDRLVAAGVTRIGVSIHSHNATLEDQITCRAGSFDAVVDGGRQAFF